MIMNQVYMVIKKLMKLKLALMKKMNIFKIKKQFYKKMVREKFA